MRFRRFAPHALRFATRDILFGDPQLPQSWNRYGFVSGNPLQRIDPLGLSDDDSGSSSGGKIAGGIIGGLIGLVVVGVVAGIGAAYVLGPQVLGVGAYNIFARMGSRLGINFAARWGGMYTQLTRGLLQAGEIEMAEIDPVLNHMNVD